MTQGDTFGSSVTESTDDQLDRLFGELPDLNAFEETEIYLSNVLDYFDAEFDEGLDSDDEACIWLQEDKIANSIIETEFRQIFANFTKVHKAKNEFRKARGFLKPTPDLGYRSTSRSLQRFQVHRQVRDQRRQQGGFKSTRWNNSCQ